MKHIFCHRSKVIAYPNANTFGRGTGPIAFNQLRCNGLESSLEQCDLSTDTHYCSHAHDIGVDCCRKSRKLFIFVVSKQISVMCFIIL